jgi:GNAT superfamily N-acetyltransferase
MQVDDAIDYGSVYAYRTADRRIVGAALWRWAPGLGPEPDDYAERLVLATGTHLERFQAFEACVESNNPPPGSYHIHLWMLGVHPGHQGRGIGTTLLEVYHRAADAAGYAIYLEAAEPRSRDLYRRHGYEDFGAPFHLPGGGAPFHPMRRDPGAGAP